MAEQIRKLPWRVIQMLRSAFQTRLNTGEDMAPSWKELVVVLIPKANGPTCELGKCRAICMIEVLNKWYMAVLTLMAKEQTDAQNNKRGEEKSRLPQYGYQEGMMVDDIVGSLLGFLRTGNCWGKELEVHCAVLDVCQAFDHLSLELCSEALEQGGGPLRRSPGQFSENCRGTGVPPGFRRSRQKGLATSIEVSGQGAKSLQGCGHYLWNCGWET